MPTSKNPPGQKPTGPPRAVQPKAAAKVSKPPAAPPVYRPHPTAKVLQRRVATPSAQPKPAHAAQARTPAAPPVYRPEAKRLVQPKAVSAQAHTPPKAPPVYRPEPRKIIQPKAALPAQAPTPKAPPVYRPQPVPRVLQTKTAPARPPLVSPAPAQPRRPVAAALQLKPARPPAPAARPRQAVIQPSLKVYGEKFRSKTQLKAWEHHGKVLEWLKRKYPNYRAIMRIFYEWAGDTDLKYSFDRWRDATDEARREIRRRYQANRWHGPEVMSPLRPNEDTLNTRVGAWYDTYSERHKGKGARSAPTENQLQGMIGEISQQITLETGGVTHKDANAICMNMPGIDTVMTGPEKFLSQSKLHLCATDTSVYLGHVDRRMEYATKLVRPLIRDTDGGRKMRDAMTLFANESNNKPLQEMVKEAAQQVGKGVSPDDLISHGDDTGLVNQVANAICFPVPSNIYTQLPSHQQEHFTQLIYDTRALEKVKAMYAYRPVKEHEKKTEDDKDKDYVG